VLRTDRRIRRTGSAVAEDFQYISRSQLVYKDGLRNAYLGEVSEPVPADALRHLVETDQRSVLRAGTPVPS
jgi:hypothetical protein